MVSAASYPPLQKTQERGTHSFGMGNEVTRKRRATRPQLQNTPSLHPDNSKDELVTTTVTTSKTGPGGFIYDIDTPGPNTNKLPAGSAFSYRANFTEFAQLGKWLQTDVVGKTGSLQDVLSSPETVSLSLDSYTAVSCNVSATGNPQINNTYQSNNDNTGGAGCTLTTVAGGSASCN